MRSKGNIILLCIVFLFISSCVHNRTSSDNHLNETHTKTTKYIPNIQNVKEPVLTIKTILEEQPPSYAWVPLELSVDERAIRMTTKAGGNFLTLGIPIPGQTNKIVIFYRYIGKAELSKDNNAPVWQVEISDKQGNVLYDAYTSTELEGKKLVDVLYYMMKYHK